MKSHKDLDVWKSAMDLATLTYKLTENFPKSEIFGLTNQMRRAAVSIPSNIAEGAARQTNKEFIQFLYIANGSIAELETQVLLAKKIGYATDVVTIEGNLINVGKMINGLIRYLKGKA
jgi:four helix bundle protein